MQVQFYMHWKIPFEWYFLSRIFCIHTQKKKKKNCALYFGIVVHCIVKTPLHSLSAHFQYHTRWIGKILYNNTARYISKKVSLSDYYYFFPFNERRRRNKKRSWDGRTRETIKSEAPARLYNTRKKGLRMK